MTSATLFDIMILRTGKPEQKGEKEMTVGTALKHAGVQVKEIGIDDFIGFTKSGKQFRMYRAGGAYGLQFTLEIEGENRISHCLYRTAVKKIKTT